MITQCMLLSLLHFINFLYLLNLTEFIRMAPVLNALVHLVSVMMYGFTLHYSFTVLYIPMIATKFEKFDPGQLKYLTMWDVVSYISFL